MSYGLDRDELSCCIKSAWSHPVLVARLAPTVHKSGHFGIGANRFAEPTCGKVSTNRDTDCPRLRTLCKFRAEGDSDANPGADATCARIFIRARNSLVGSVGSSGGSRRPGSDLYPNPEEAMKTSDLEARIAELEAQNKALAAKASKVGQGRISFKVSTKGAVSVYGLGRWPVTLYRSQMERLLTSAPDITAFMAANSAALAVKGEEASVATTPA